MMFRFGQQSVQTILHFTGRFAGKSDGQNAIVVGFLQQPGDATRQDARLTRTGTGHHAGNGLGGLRDGFDLIGVEILKYGRHRL